MRSVVKLPLHSTQKHRQASAVAGHGFSPTSVLRQSSHDAAMIQSSSLGCAIGTVAPHVVTAVGAPSQRRPWNA